MFLGALVDAGVPEQLLQQTVAALNIGARLEISQVKRNGIRATKVDVYSNGEKDLPRDMYWEQQAGQSGLSRHHHGNSEHEHAHANAHTESEPVALLEHNYALQNPASSRAGASSPQQAHAGSGNSEPAPHQHDPEHDHSHSHEHGR